MFERGTRHVNYTHKTYYLNIIEHRTRQLRQALGKKISFAGIPNSPNILFLQIFLQRAAKPSAGNTSACSKAMKPSPEPSPEHC
jgi:hypothetical protein